MLRFECDYAEGAHPLILEALCSSNPEQSPGYGTDTHCGNARNLIRQACEAPEAVVEFLVGGTQTNTTLIAAALRPHQGVLSAATGHINVHETGAIESTGHKVLALPAENGKITAAQVDAACQAHFEDKDHEHMVQPGMVYLSQPTENGSLYTLAELTEMHRICRKWALYLYVDGARCGYGLAAPANDVGLADLARLTDAFYIGGTKVGALFGEALVVSAPALQRDLRYFIKQHGGMLAKGRLLGIQFETLFRDDLYLKISRQAVELAQRLRRAFEAKGIPMGYDSPTNQQFPLLTKAQQAKLAEKYAFCFWEKADESHDIVRFCTSWATSEEAVATLEADIAAL